METKTTDRRMVSQGRYAVNLGEKTFFSSVGVGLCLLSLLCVWVICKVYFQLPVSLTHDTLFLALLLLLTVGIGFVFRLGVLTLKKAKQIDPGVPLTRANTADLPAPDILVRASEEPRQAQQAVLLRAATAGQETPPEQLVRAVNGRE